MKMKLRSCIITWKETESLATKANMSAQETTPGQVSSSWTLISSMIPNPARPRFVAAAFSAVLFGVESINIEPSQP